MPDTPANSGQPISEDDVRKVAKLARLTLTDEEVHHFTDQLAAVLGYIGKISELDVEGVEPMAHPLDLTNVFREDVEDKDNPAHSRDALLANAPDRAEAFFKVPKVLGDGGGA